MENQDNGIKVIILEEDIKIQKIENVKVIRIKSSKYNLLIMKDYLPVVGYIDGAITIETENDRIIYEKIKGFFSNTRNLFYLIIKEKENE